MVVADLMGRVSRVLLSPSQVKSVRESKQNARVSRATTPATKLAITWPAFFLEHRKHFSVSMM